MKMSKAAHKDTVNPPGQFTYPVRLSDVIEKIEVEEGVKATYKLIVPEPKNEAPAKMASSAGEPEVWALVFPGDSRLNLSTIFDTEAEAREYVERCGAAEVVPLCRCLKSTSAGERTCDLCGGAPVYRMWHCNVCKADYADEQCMDENLAAFKAAQPEQRAEPQGLTPEEINAIGCARKAVHGLYGTESTTINVASLREQEDFSKDAARWRRLVNASELAFPVATIVDDPENDKNMLYGRKRLENYIDGLDEISDSYDAQRLGRGKENGNG